MMKPKSKSLTNHVVDGTYGLSIVDGVVCVTCIVMNSSNPKVHRVHWPTNLNRGSLRNWYGKDFDLGKTHVVPAHGYASGEFVIYPDYQKDAHGFAKFGIGTTIKLVDGGRTMPIKTDQAKVFEPHTTRDFRWYQGRWQVHLKSGWRDYKYGKVEVQWEGGAS